MSRRIEVSRDAPAVRIPGRVLHELFAHARETAPEECCGLVTGAGRERYRHVARCRNEMTRLHHEDPATHPRDGCDAFFINPFEYERVRVDAQARGERVTAIYHSHVGAGAYLSEMDLEFAENELFPFPDAAHIVIGLIEAGAPSSPEYRVSDVGCFERGARTRTFGGRPVEADPS
jgi:[CysO sulfur-carrier protein]-S-L-cysteine hydrolase